MAAGDIACDPQSSNFNGGKWKNGNCQMMATSDVVIKAKPNAVLALGDNQYEKGEFANFQASYDPTWGRFKSITRPVAGNHEYYGSNAEGYYQYFGKAAGDRDKGYYSFNLGNWHLIALNSNCKAIGGCEVGSPQEKWLKADLQKKEIVILKETNTSFIKNRLQSISSNKTGMQSISCKSVPSPIVKQTKKKYIYQRPKKETKTGISSLLR